MAQRSRGRRCVPQVEQQSSKQQRACRSGGEHCRGLRRGDGPASGGGPGWPAPAVVGPIRWRPLVAWRLAPPVTYPRINRFGELGARTKAGRLANPCGAGDLDCGTHLPHQPAPAGSAVSRTAGRIVPSHWSPAVIRTRSICPTSNYISGSVLATSRTLKRPRRCSAHRCPDRSWYPPLPFGEFYRVADEDADGH